MEKASAAEMIQSVYFMFSGSDSYVLFSIE